MNARRVDVFWVGSCEWVDGALARDFKGAGWTRAGRGKGVGGTMMMPVTREVTAHGGGRWGRAFVPVVLPLPLLRQPPVSRDATREATPSRSGTGCLVPGAAPLRTPRISWASS